jgi:hypothetical protein
MAERLPLTPVLRRRLWMMMPPTRCEPDLKQHVVEHRLPARRAGRGKAVDGDRAALEALVGRLHVELLGQPAWVDAEPDLRGAHRRVIKGSPRAAKLGRTGLAARSSRVAAAPGAAGRKRPLWKLPCARSRAWPPWPDGNAGAWGCTLQLHHAAVDGQARWRWPGHPRPAGHRVSPVRGQKRRRSSARDDRDDLRGVRRQARPARWRTSSAGCRPGARQGRWRRSAQMVALQRARLLAGARAGNLTLAPRMALNVR